MQKTVPLKYGEYYHIYNRGNNRENIFFEERNYEHFLKLYVKYILPVADTYAYCLLKNHFHFLLRIKTEEEQEILKTSLAPFKPLNPTQQFANWFNSYTKAINKAYQRVGSLFQNRFGRIQVDSDNYFIQLVTYIHRNPEKHGFVDDFRTYPYSSYQAISHQKNTHLKSEKVLDWFGNLENFNHYHQSLDNNIQISHLIGDDLL